MRRVGVNNQKDGHDRGYASGCQKEVQALERKINELQKEKCKIPNGMKYEYMHVYKDLWGLGSDKLEDTVGYEKLKIMLKGLNDKG